MLVCLECGYVFDEGDAAIWREDRGEFWGSPCSEELSGCPRCKRACVEAYKCDCCGEWISGDYIKIDGDRYCENCYDKYELGEE